MQVLPCSNENEIYTVSVLPKALSTAKPFLWCMHIKYCIVAQQSSAVTSYINLLQLSMMCMLALKTGGLSKSSISPSDRSEALIKGVLEKFQFAQVSIKYLMLLKSKNTRREVSSSLAIFEY